MKSQTVFLALKMPKSLKAKIRELQDLILSNKKSGHYSHSTPFGFLCAYRENSHYFAKITPNLEREMILCSAFQLYICTLLCGCKLIANQWKKAPFFLKRDSYILFISKGLARTLKIARSVNNAHRTWWFINSKSIQWMSSGLRPN